MIACFLKSVQPNHEALLQCGENLQMHLHDQCHVAVSNFGELQVYSLHLPSCGACRRRCELIFDCCCTGVIACSLKSVQPNHQSLLQCGENLQVHLHDQCQTIIRSCTLGWELSSIAAAPYLSKKLQEHCSRSSCPPGELISSARFSICNGLQANHHSLLHTGVKAFSPLQALRTC